MKFDIEEFFTKNNYDDEKKKYFSSFNIDNVSLIQEKELVVFRISNECILPYKLYENLKEYFSHLEFPNNKLIFNVDNQDFSILEITHYLKAYTSIHNNFFNECVVTKNGDDIVLSYIDESEMQKDESDIDNLKLYFRDIGCRADIFISLQKSNEPVEETRTALPAREDKKDFFAKTNNYYKARVKTYTDVGINELIDTLFNVRITCQIFKVDEFTTRNGLLIQTIYVKDYDDACTVKMIENKKNTREVLAENKIGRWAKFSGNYRFDNYSNDYIFEPDSIEYIDDPSPLKDDAIKKRVELHAHTKLSEMDGVSSPEEIVNAAYSMGHKAVAITDHLCLQGYHEAKVAYDKIKKNNKDTDFKVIYGCEMNLVEPNLNIVYNADNRNLFESEYIVFDLETTGLSTRYDYVIEFGAVLMYRGMVKEKYDFFIKPPVALSDFTKNLTHISENDLKDAKPFSELKDTILNILKDRILVAHNASFDFGFLNSELERINEPKLSNPVIDTLDLSRSILKNRRAYRLGNMARAYNIEYDEEVAHRADYDADVLSQVFNLMLKDCAKENVKTLEELRNFQDADAFIKNRAYHTTILCKNKSGLKDLFKLVSISNTDNLAVFGKANTKDTNSDFLAEPRIFKENINKYRKDLLIGSACFNGEVFEIAHTRSKEELAKAISFYDYIEIQPIENYRPLFEERESFSKDRLYQYLKDIIDESLKQKKLIVATGDVHFVRKEDKVLRDVYINAKAIGGTHHPLYIFDKEKRSKQVTPDQRFLNTNEMLEAFYWYDDKRVVEAMVIDNPNVIAEMCENYSPFPDELYAPKIIDALEKAKSCGIIEEPFTERNDVISADDYLKELVYYNAHKKYGDKLDPIIENRIEKELKSIIGNGYGVIYFVCHLMVKRSNDDGYIVGSRGSVGSSLVATLSGITEVNPLSPYYLCPNCHRLEWVKDAASGYDLKNKKCPDCGQEMIGDGQNIPFETFLGFHGDKIPDIDLNFSGDYQPKAHLFTREIFGEKNVFRAGTTSTVADKIAFGYVTGYCEEKNITNMSRAQKERLAQGCTGVKRTTGQHAGGIVVLPDDMEIEDITPIQYPANDKQATWHSTHFEFHDFSENLLKFDILGHVDPTAMKLFENISKIDVKTIPMNDEKVLSLFYSSKALDIVNPNYHEETGACGLPEFGTLNTRNTIEKTRPRLFSELVQISGLSHGTDVWRGNAEELIKKGILLKDVIGCRDDIMSRLITYNLEPKDAFDIMEKVRKGKGLTQDEEQLLLNHNVPPWYIESCKKIQYMFPKAHAVAYCIMAVRVAWFKVYYPEYYYVSYFSLRCDAYEIETMIKDADDIYTRMQELRHKIVSREANKKEKDIFNTLEVCYEMTSRGYHLSNIDLYKSLATEFKVNPDNNKEIIPPFKVLDGLGDNVAESIVEARNKGDFLSKEDLGDRTLLSTTLIKKLDQLGVLNGLDESNQISLF